MQCHRHLHDAGAACGGFPSWGVGSSVPSSSGRSVRPQLTRMCSSLHRPALLCKCLYLDAYYSAFNALLFTSCIRFHWFNFSRLFLYTRTYTAFPFLSVSIRFRRLPWTRMHCVIRWIIIIGAGSMHTSKLIQMPGMHGLWFKNSL